MSIGPIFSALNEYLEDKSYMVDMLKELRDPAVRRLSDMAFFKGREFPGRMDGLTTVEHIETHWFGWDHETGVQDAFDPDNPMKTGWWSAWHGNAYEITRETLRRALEVALGVSHDAKDVTPTRQWQLMINWTCGAPTFQGWVMWQSVQHDEATGCVVCTFSTPGNGNSLYATPYHAGASPSGKGSPLIVGDRGMWVIGDRITDIRMADGKWNNEVTGELPDWTGAFIHTHGAGNDSGVAVVSPPEVDGGVRPTRATS
jgi:hypothetical protein